MSDYMRDLRARVGTSLLEIPSVALAIRDDAGRVLLGRYLADGRWLLPGGCIEPLENPADAALREGHEETGLHLELRRIVGVYGGPLCRVRYPNGDEIAFVATVFEARVSGGTERPDGEELSELRWFDRKACADLDTPAWVTPILADIFAGAGEAAFAASEWKPPVA
jgi:8-oxo-dGTP pyrophosphatase MutT (NUDIX family)